MSASSRLITEWIRHLTTDEYRARAERIVVSYFLEPLARTLAKRVRELHGKNGVEDAALHALTVALDKVRQGDTADFPSRGALFAFLIVIGQHILWKMVREENAARRGGGRIGQDGDSGLLDGFASPDLPPNLVVEATEECERLLAVLSDEQRLIVLWKVEGRTNREIARELGCVETTVERKLKQIRDGLKELVPR
jgi:RNA polymerase sigma factor (sigma-70 family)